MAAGYDGSIRIDTKMNTKNFNKGTADINKGVSGIAGALKKMSVAMGIAMTAKELVKFGKQAISLASDVTEVQNVVDTAFGSMSNKMEEFAETSIEQFGMSKLVAKQMGSTYMAMGRGMGLGMEEGADMAIGATARIGDVASFYNKSFEEVDTMMKSIWTGETESLKRIGVVMTETNLQAFALSQGIQKNVSDMTQAEKTQLRYAFVMDQTKLAAGDFAKTSGSWANQTRILSEQWKEFLTVMGEGLIKVLTPALQFLNRLMSALVKFATKFGEMTAILFGKQKNEADQTADSILALSGAQEELAENTEKANKATKKTLSTFDVIHKMTESGTVSGTPSVNIPAIGGDEDDEDTEEKEKELTNLEKKLLRLKGILKDFWKGFKTSWDEHVEPIREAFRTLIDNIVQVFSNYWYNYLKPIFTKISDKLSELWKKYLKPLWDNIKGFVFDLIGLALLIYNKVILPIVIWVQDKLYPILVSVFGAMTDIIGEFVGGVIRVFNGWITALRGYIKFLTGIFTGDWKKAWEGIKQIFEGVWEAIKGGIASWLNPTMTIFEKFINMIIWGINFLIDKINSMSIEFPDWLKKRTGANGIGFNIKKVSEVTLPRLATGAVIPPRSEFLAVLGDQKSGTNIEAPEGLIRKIMREEMGNSQGGDWYIYLMRQDGTVESETIITAAQRKNRKAGKTIIPVGV